jgi:hypothetical protein
LLHVTEKPHQEIRKGAEKRKGKSSFRLAARNSKAVAGKRKGSSSFRFAARSKISEAGKRKGSMKEEVEHERKWSMKEEVELIFQIC